jgi:hypothetical protein
VNKAVGSTRQKVRQTPSMDLSTLLTKPPFAVAVYALLRCENRQRAFAAQGLTALCLSLPDPIISSASSVRRERDRRVLSEVDHKGADQADPPGIGRARLGSRQMSDTCRLPANATLKIRGDMG